MTFATPLVEILLKLLPLLTVVLNLEEMLPLGTKGRRKTVCQMKGDKLRETWLVTMRQITALMPATKTLFGVFKLQ